MNSINLVNINYTIKYINLIQIVFKTTKDKRGKKRNNIKRKNGTKSNKNNKVKQYKQPYDRYIVNLMGGFVYKG